MSAEISGCSPVSSRSRISSNVSEHLGELNGGYVNKAVSIEDTMDHEYIQVAESMEHNIEMGEMSPRHVGSPASANARQVSVTESGDAVIVRNAEKSYQKGHPILDGFNMTVPCGSIYGLLGPSGCGKTSVLECIVGLRRLDKGKIWIYGHKPGSKETGIPGKNVGYMPQELSLYTEFTIAETLTYFGTLGGLTRGQVKSSMKFLIDLLDLPEESRQAARLSGGQQRRLSFAVALIHNPELLILDEPTVGVDPLVRQNIWNHLSKLASSQRTTVIITTHYFEECRNADNIGFMRSGRLLTERPPLSLMNEHGSTNLEKIILALAKSDAPSSSEVTPQQNRKISANSGRYVEEATSPTKLNDGKLQDNHPGVKMASVLREPGTGLEDAITRIKALTGKNFVILFRNPLLLFFVVLISAVLVVMICIGIGSDPRDLPLGFVNNELDYDTFCHNATRIRGECTLEGLSCQYLRNVPKETIDLIHFETEEEAAREVSLGHTWGYLVFKEEFSTAFFERSVSGANPDELTLNTSEIVVRLDESSKQISATIKKALYDSFDDFIGEMLEDCGYDRRQGESVLVYGKPLFGKDGTIFLEFMAPGLALAVIFFFPIITTSIRYIKEKKSGVLQRSVVGGVKTMEIFFAYSITEFCVLLVQSLLTYFVLTVPFSIEVLGSHLLLIVMYILSGYGGVSMGFLFGMICNEEIEAAILAMAAFFPNFILSGIIWPLEGMVTYLQQVVLVLPCTLGAETVRSVTSRGWEFTHPSVWPGFVILVGYIFGYFVLTVFFHVILRK